MDRGGPTPLELRRELSGRRALLGVAALVAVLAGLLVVYRPFSFEPRAREVGVASAAALVDTPRSQVVNLGVQSSVEGSALPGRAALLANLLASSPLKDSAARRANVRPDFLIAIPPPSTGAPAPGPVSDALASSASIGADDPRASTLRLAVDAALPIISVSAQAPTPESAARLADSAIAVLRDNVDELAREKSIPEPRRLVVKPLGPARAGIKHTGPGPVAGVIVGMLVFLTLAAIIGFAPPAIRERRRKAAAAGDAAPPVHDDAVGQSSLTVLKLPQESSHSEAAAPGA